MDRLASQELLEWKNTQDRKPLLLQGARQVGKTYLLQAFGAAHYENVVCFNFERDLLLAELFEKSLDPAELLPILSLKAKQPISPEKTLIIFDEVQACPAALNSLKYFCESANQYHVAAAGSLLGVKLQKEGSFPVGKVNFLTIYPLTYAEYLLARGKADLKKYLDNWSLEKDIPEMLHQELLSLFKEYTVVGGMPEAVSTFCRTQDFTLARKKHTDILTAYLLDFAKHAGQESFRIQQVWNSFPAQFSKENRKFIWKLVREGARAREYEIALQWLIDAGLVHKSIEVAIPTLPLSHHADLHYFKTFLLDTGLLATLCEMPFELLIDDQQIFQFFKGALMENYFAQALIANDTKNLYYWTSGSEAEIDFLLTIQGNIVPIEVKSGKNVKSKSLLSYQKKYQPKLALRFSTLTYHRSNNAIIDLPLYLMDWLKQKVFVE